MKNSWKRLSGRVVHKTPWIEVVEDKVLHRGQKAVYTYINVNPAAFILPLTDKKEVYLVGQWRYPTGCYSWELPCGAVHKGESLLASAKRELLEETDLRAKDWQSVGRFYFANGGSNQIAHVFVARDLFLDKGAGVKNETEDLAVKKVKLSTFEKMIKDNIITDGPSIAAYFRAKLYLRL